MPDHDGHALLNYDQLLPPATGWVAAAAVGLLIAPAIGVRWPSGRAYATASLTLVTLLLLTVGVTLLLQDGVASGLASQREDVGELYTVVTTTAPAWPRLAMTAGVTAQFMATVLARRGWSHRPLS